MRSEFDMIGGVYGVQMRLDISEVGEYLYIVLTVKRVLK